MKEEKMVRVTFTLTPERKKKIHELSHKAQINLSQWINKAISVSIEKEGSKA